MKVFTLKEESSGLAFVSNLEHKLMSFDSDSSFKDRKLGNSSKLVPPFSSSDSFSYKIICSMSTQLSIFICGKRKEISQVPT